MPSAVIQVVSWYHIRLRFDLVDRCARYKFFILLYSITPKDQLRGVNQWFDTPKILRSNCNIVQISYLILSSFSLAATLSDSDKQQFK